MSQKTSLLGSIKWQPPSLDHLRDVASNYSNVLMFLLFVGVAILQIWWKREETKKRPRNPALPAPDFPPVEELQKFDWKSKEPLKLRPFKAKYHLTMALETLDPNELLLMDKNYHDRINHRRRILKEYPSIALRINKDTRIRPAVSELYTFLTGTYLPSRFPTMFKLHHAAYEYGSEAVLQNLVTGEILPTRATSAATPTSTLLATLGRHLDEDFLLLLPEEGVDKPAAKYILEAYVTCCPSGFNPANKLGKKLRDIHAPVPGYDVKLDGSMDRFFTKLEVGKYVKRANWSITLSEELFQPGSGTNHARVGDELEEFKGPLDPEKTFVRCERQTLHRLPRSEALVFAFKTYMYPIRQIKEEGLGEELATAIDGLKGGNVPEMYIYKRGVEWGAAVKKYLRS